MSGAACEDPLTGLVSFAYLRTRLRELYRDAEQQGTCSQATHRLVVVELPRRPARRLRASRRDEARSRRRAGRLRRPRMPRRGG